MVALTEQKEQLDSVVREDEVYQLPDFKRRVRWTKHTLASAKRKGLKVLYHGRYGVVRGSDYFEFLRNLDATK